MTATALAARPVASPQLKLEVVGIRDQTPLVRSFTFRDPERGQLPGFVPGSHIVVRCGAKANAYSLTGSGLHPTAYTISVRRADDGAGGSAAMHRISVGDTVTVSRPRSAFPPVSNATHHLLIAGGIGITPMLSHARAANEWGRPSSLIYSYRHGEGAHLEEVRAAFATGLTECPDREGFGRVLQNALVTQLLGTHLYVCGPAEFMKTVLTQAELAGWPADRLHSEPFGAADQAPGQPFRVRLARSGKRLSVPAGQSLLEALEGSGTAVPNMCRKGVCGECAVPVLRGRVEHRDLFLTDEEKAANNTAMCCVSRSQDQELELDL
jgi:ferredoxin-NADP reductase